MTTLPLYDYLIYIGRFNTYHNGHKSIADKALKITKRLIFVLGSDRSPRTTHNPFTSEEREKMIRACHEGDSIEFIYLEDFGNTPLWVAALQHKVHEITGYDSKVGLTGFKKDYTSSYLDELHWKFEGPESRFPQNASDLRDVYYRLGSEGHSVKKNGKTFPLADDVPEGSFKFLQRFEKTHHYNLLRKQYLYHANYKKMTQTPVSFFVEKLKEQLKDVVGVTISDIERMAEEHIKLFPQYPVQFNAVDTLVTHRGHVLLVRRNSEDGDGLLALPGGFVMPNERVETAAFRELKEETTITRSKELLKTDKVKGPFLFDDPYRSLRGRTFTHAFLVQIPANVAPPRVKGDDDAKGKDGKNGAMWMTFTEAYRRKDEFFEDHYMILEKLLKMVDD